jgi:glycosyltransferase involved in cell wall biosynthesis
MKVMHVIAGLGTGGAETQLVNLVTSACPDGTESIVVNLLPIDSGPNPRRLQDAGIEVHHLGLSGIGNLIGTRNRLSRLIRSIKPDIVQSWMYYGDFLSFSAIRKGGLLGRVEHFWNIRCSDMDLQRYSRRLRWVVRRCAAHSGKLSGVVVNSIAGQEVHHRAGYRPRAWHLIDNGIDTDRFSPGDKRMARGAVGFPQDRPIAVHIARVDPMKDHDTLIRVAAKAPQWFFVAIGAGTENLKGPPNLVGQGRRDDVDRLAQAADVVLSTSAFGEGFSNALAEGMACGLLPISTDVGDSARLLDAAGWVVPPQTPGHIVGVLNEVAAFDAAEYARRSAVARDRIVAEFGIDRMVERYNSLYRQAIAK